jgi:hypothetical protein
MRWEDVTETLTARDRLIVALDVDSFDTPRLEREAERNWKGWYHSDTITIG